MKGARSDAATKQTSHLAKIHLSTRVAPCLTRGLANLRQVSASNMPDTADPADPVLGDLAKREGARKAEPRVKRGATEDKMERDMAARTPPSPRL
jgi:hypothetical protein